MRRIGTGSGDELAIPRLVALHDSPRYSGSDYIGIRRTGASIVRGVGIAPVALGLSGLLLLFGSTVLAWLYEGQRFRRRGTAAHR